MRVMRIELRKFENVWNIAMHIIIYIRPHRCRWFSVSVFWFFDCSKWTINNKLGGPMPLKRVFPFSDFSFPHSLSHTHTHFLLLYLYVSLLCYRWVFGGALLWAVGLCRQFMENWKKLKLLTKTGIEQASDWCCDSCKVSGAHAIPFQIILKPRGK